MSVRSAQAVTVEFVTSSFTTGAATNADSLPTGTLVVNGTDNGASVTVTNVDTGRYKAAVTLPTLAVGDIVELVIAATVGGVAGKGVIWRDSKDVLLDSSGDVTFNNTSIATVTNLTNLPAIPNGWLTAAGIAASALNGKGDWLVSSSYPTNFGAMVISLGGIVGADVQTIKGQAVTCAASVTVGAFVGNGTAAIAVSAGGKITEVVLVDTLTTYTGNTPQTGDSFARIGATGSGLTTLAFHSDALAIEAAITALGSPMQAGAVVQIDTTRAVPTTGNTANSIADCLNAARAQGFGPWSIVSNTLTLYAADGTTTVHSFTLSPSALAATQRA